MEESDNEHAVDEADEEDEEEYDDEEMDGLRTRRQSDVDMD
jgi:protein-serine/threonine kinase